MPNLFNIDFLEFLELLSKHQVDYILVGGYAVILHGYGRSRGTWIYGLIKPQRTIIN